MTPLHTRSNAAVQLLLRPKMIHQCVQLCFKFTNSSMRVVASIKSHGSSTVTKCLCDSLTNTLQGAVSSQLPCLDRRL